MGGGQNDPSPKIFLITFVCHDFQKIPLRQKVMGVLQCLSHESTFLDISGTPKMIPQQVFGLFLKKKI